MKRLLALLLAALLAGCGTIHNTSRDGADERLALRGNDPVAYFTEGRPVRGDPAIRSQHDGDVYRFTSEAHKRLFGADVFMSYKGRLYLFGSERSKANWLLDSDANIRLGDEYWEKESKDVPYRLQNFKRLVSKVGHYKTDRELDAEHLKRYGKLPPGAPPPR